MTDLQQAQRQVEIGEALTRLLNNKDYQLVFQEMFHDDYMKTVGINYATGSEALRAKFHENIAARGIFNAFVVQTLEQAHRAFDFIQMLQQEQEEMQNQTQGEVE